MGREVIDILADVFLRRGADSYLGEQVTMSEHMYQCAQLAADDGADDTLIAACLLHDIGHYSGEFAEDAADHGIDNRHDRSGGELLARHFPPAVSEPVRLHVLAKRYLCSAEPAYFAQLSAASVHSLELQGGPLDADGRRRFEAEPFADAAVRLRRYDEGAKQVGVDVPGFEHWRPMLERLLLA
ncbi:MAG: HD domain-containing protein [Planctomycetes bacterium]|nr:HD domain-containing protein [Planctomycetota bacterium]